MNSLLSLLLLLFCVANFVLALQQRRRLSRARDAIARVEAVCAEWDQLSKGQTPTTWRIRTALTERDA